MKNLLFLCVFHNDQFVELLNLCLESIYTYGELDENTDILIYTSTEFKERIQSSSLYTNPTTGKTLLFYTNDSLNSVDSACKARLDLFDIPLVQGYEKILYLDTDVLITKRLSPVFDLIQDNKLYAMEEGTIDWHTNYWGATLFGEEIHSYEDKTAFSSGVMGFLHSLEIRDLFQRIKDHIHEEPQWFECYDQPYIVYHTKKSGFLDNQAFLSCVVGNSPFGNATDHDPNTDKTIVHFCGGPGIANHKLVNMKKFRDAYCKLLRVRSKLRDACFSWKHDQKNVDGTIEFRGTEVVNSFSENGMFRILPGGISAEVYFSCENHTLFFNHDFTKFTSIRTSDSHISSGERIS